VISGPTAGTQRRAGGDAARGLRALWRWRARDVLSTLPAGPERDRLRSVPLLFHCVFPDVALQEPPGVSDFQPRGAVRRVSRLFGVQRPTGVQNARPLVSALFVERPARPGGPYPLVVLMAPGTSGAHAAAVGRTCASVEVLAKRQGLGLQFTVVPATEQAQAGCLPALAVFGGLLGGSPPSDALSLALGPGMLPPEALPALLSRGAEPFEALALLCAAGVPIPSGRALVELARTAPGLVLSPAAAAVAMASRSGETRDILFPLLARRASTLRTRQWAGRVVPKVTDDLLVLERKLLLHSARAISRTTGPLRAALRRAWASFAGGVGLPAGAPPVGPLLLTFDRGLFSLSRGRGGQVISRGKARAHAQLRGALLGHPAPEVPGLAHILKWVAEPVPSARLLYLVADTVELPQVVRVHVRPGARPSCRVLGMREAILSVLQAQAGRRPVDIRPISAELAPVADRLLRLARLPQVPGAQSAVQVEGRVIVGTAGSLRQYALARYALRPRRYVTDAESWELNGSRFPGTLERCQKAGASTITCFGLGMTDRRSALLVYGDSQGTRFSESIPLEQVEGRLEEAQSLLRAQPQPQLLNIQLEDELLARVERLSREHLHPVQVKLKGRDGRFTAEVRGETFGHGCEWGWDAAQQTLLSYTPVGRQLLIAFPELDVTVGGEQVGGLKRLYVRSAAWRRLTFWMNRNGTP